MKKDYQYGEKDWILSFNKISGKKIKDIGGYISNEFGEPTFKICYLYFEDGSEQGVEGEHDFPYIVDYDDKIVEVMESIHEEEEKKLHSNI